MKFLKGKFKHTPFVYVLFASLVVAGIPIYSVYSLHQTCLDKWHFILALVDGFLGVKYFRHANISYSIKAS